MNNLCQKNRCRTLSTLIAAIFLFVEICFPVQGLSQSITMTKGVDSEVTPSAFALDLPPEMGKIESLYSGTARSTSSLQRAGGQAGQVPSLVHIQTAHGNYEAQKKIESILHHLKEEYGFKHVFLEGTAFKLESNLLNLFPDFQDATREILDRLTKKAYVKGPELFLKDVPDAEGYGIENVQVYRKNGEAFKEVLTQQEITNEFLQDMEIQIERLTAPYLSGELKNFIKLYEKFEKNLYPFLDWLNFLKNKSRENFEVDLEDVAWQLEWPMLVRLFAIERITDDLDRSRFNQERKDFIKAIKRFMGATSEVEHIEKLLTNPTTPHRLSDPETYLLFETMVRQLPENFDYGQFPHTKQVIGRLILQSEIKPMELINEMNRLTNENFDVLATSRDQKQVVELLKDYWLLDKLFKLELTPEEYDEILRKNRGDENQRLNPEVIIKRFLELNRDGRVKDIEFKNIDAMTKLYHASLKFYSLVKKRDGLMIKNLEEKMAELGTKKAVVITGGFHATPFEEHFKKKGFNYALVMPKITTVDGKEAYVKSVLQTSTYESIPSGSHSEPVIAQLGVSPKKSRAAVIVESSQVLLVSETRTMEEFNAALASSKMLGRYNMKLVKNPNNDSDYFGIRRAETRIALIPTTTQTETVTRGFVVPSDLSRARFSPSSSVATDAQPPDKFNQDAIKFGFDEFEMKKTIAGFDGGDPPAGTGDGFENGGKGQGPTKKEDIIQPPIKKDILPPLAEKEDISPELPDLKESQNESESETQSEIRTSTNVLAPVNRSGTRSSETRTINLAEDDQQTYDLSEAGQNVQGYWKDFFYGTEVPADRIRWIITFTDPDNFNTHHNIFFGEKPIQTKFTIKEYRDLVNQLITNYTEDPDDSSLSSELAQRESDWGIRLDSLYQALSPDLRTQYAESFRSYVIEYSILFRVLHGIRDSLKTHFTAQFISRPVYLDITKRPNQDTFTVPLKGARIVYGTDWLLKSSRQRDNPGLMIQKPSRQAPQTVRTAVSTNVRFRDTHTISFHGNNHDRYTSLKLLPGQPVRAVQAVDIDGKLINVEFEFTRKGDQIEIKSFSDVPAFYLRQESMRQSETRTSTNVLVPVNRSGTGSSETRRFEIDPTEADEVADIVKELGIAEDGTLQLNFGASSFASLIEKLSGKNLKRFKEIALKDLLLEVQAYHDFEPEKWTSVTRNAFILDNESLFEALQNNGFFEVHNKYFSNFLKKYILRKEVDEDRKVTGKLRPYPFNVAALPGSGYDEDQKRAMGLVQNLTQVLLEEFSNDSKKIPITTHLFGLGQLNVEGVSPSSFERWLAWGLDLLAASGVGQLLNLLVRLALVPLFIAFINSPEWATFWPLLGTAAAAGILWKLSLVFGEWAKHRKANLYSNAPKNFVTSLTPEKVQEKNTKFNEAFSNIQKNLLEIKDPYYKNLSRVARFREKRNDKQKLKFLKEILREGAVDQARYSDIAQNYAEITRLAAEGGVAISFDDIIIAILKDLRETNPDGRIWNQKEKKWQKIPWQEVEDNKKKNYFFWDQTTNYLRGGRVYAFISSARTIIPSLLNRKIQPSPAEQILNLIPQVQLQSRQEKLEAMAEKKAHQILSRLIARYQHTNAVQQQALREKEKLLTKYHLKFEVDFQNQFLDQLESSTLSPSQKKSVVQAYLTSGSAKLVELLRQEKNAAKSKKKVDDRYRDRVIESAQINWMKFLDRVETKSKDYGFSGKEEVQRWKVFIHSEDVRPRTNAERIQSKTKKLPQGTYRGVTRAVIPGVVSKARRGFLPNGKQAKVNSVELSQELVLSGQRAPVDLIRQEIDASPEIFAPVANEFHENYRATLGDRSNVYALNRNDYLRSLMFDARLFDVEEFGLTADRLRAKLDPNSVQVNKLLNNIHDKNSPKIKLTLLDFAIVREFITGKDSEGNDLENEITEDELRFELEEIYRLGKGLAPDEKLDPNGPEDNPLTALAQLLFTDGMEAFEENGVMKSRKRKSEFTKILNMQTAYQAVGESAFSAEQESGNQFTVVVNTLEVPGEYVIRTIKRFKSPDGETEETQKERLRWFIGLQADMVAWVIGFINDFTDEDNYFDLLEKAVREEYGKEHDEDYLNAFEELSEEDKGAIRILRLLARGVHAAWSMDPYNAKERQGSYTYDELAQKGDQVIRDMSVLGILRQIMTPDRYEFFSGAIDLLDRLEDFEKKKRLLNDAVATTPRVEYKGSAKEIEVEVRELLAIEGETEDAERRRARKIYEFRQAFAKFSEPDEIKKVVDILIQNLEEQQGASAYSRSVIDNLARVIREFSTTVNIAKEDRGKLISAVSKTQERVSDVKDVSEGDPSIDDIKSALSTTLRELNILSETRTSTDVLAPVNRFGTRSSETRTSTNVLAPVDRSGTRSSETRTSTNVLAPVNRFGTRSSETRSAASPMTEDDLKEAKRLFPNEKNVDYLHEKGFSLESLTQTLYKIYNVFRDSPGLQRSVASFDEVKGVIDTALNSAVVAEEKRASMAEWSQTLHTWKTDPNQKSTGGLSWLERVEMAAQLRSSETREDLAVRDFEGEAPTLLSGSAVTIAREFTRGIFPLFRASQLGPVALAAALQTQVAVQVKRMQDIGEADKRTLERARQNVQRLAAQGRISEQEAEGLELLAQLVELGATTKRVVPVSIMGIPDSSQLSVVVAAAMMDPKLEFHFMIVEDAKADFSKRLQAFRDEVLGGAFDDYGVVLKNLKIEAASEDVGNTINQLYRKDISMGVVADAREVVEQMGIRDRLVRVHRLNPASSVAAITFATSQMLLEELNFAEHYSKIFSGEETLKALKGLLVKLRTRISFLKSA